MTHTQPACALKSAGLLLGVTTGGAQDLAGYAGAAAARRTAPDQALAALAALAARQEAALRRCARAVQDAQAAGDPRRERAELAAYESVLDAHLAGAPTCLPFVCNKRCGSSAPVLRCNGMLATLAALQHVRTTPTRICAVAM